MDAELPAKFSIEWMQWQSELSQLNHIRIPRWNNFSPEVTLSEIPGFADSSKLAYEAALHLRVYSRSAITTSLVISKSKVATLKVMSIPRLELSAAFLLAKLTHYYINICHFAVHSVRLWTDLADVLYWLEGQSSKWPVFVANRCLLIHEMLPKAQWHHLRLKETPANIILRDRSAKGLINHNIYGGMDLPFSLIRFNRGQTHRKVLLSQLKCLNPLAI